MAAAVLFGAASCVKEDISSSLAGGEVEITFTANLADLGTRAIGDAGHIDVVYLGVYEKNSNTPLSNLVKAEGYPVNNGVANFSVVLLKDKYYDLVFWAQKKGLDCYTIEWDERKLTVDYQTVNAQDETRDAFFGVWNNWRAGHDNTEFRLHRPFAQLNAGLSTEDVTNITNNGVDVEDLYSAVVVENVASTLDLGYTTPGAVANPVAVGFASAAKPTQALTVNGVEYNYLSMNYLLVNDKQNVDITYSFVEDGANEVPYVRPYYNVPVQRNYRTNIIGNLISSPMDFTVIIDSEFNADYDVEGTVVSATVNDVAELTAALQDDEVNVVNFNLAGNIDLNNVATRAALSSIIIEPGKSLNIDLNGYTLSGVESATGSFGLLTNRGNLTIDDSKGTGAIKLSATENRGWNAYSSVISNQPGGVLVVNGGTIEHLGGTDMAYGIDNLTNGKGTSAVATINGGHIKSTYRAIRQFLNGIEATNSLTVNGGIIEGANKSIWMQDPSANANTGDLTVTADAELKGDVYLYVCEGSTKWPVSVSIAEAALVGESKVLSGNVPDGYQVILNDGYYKVINATPVSTADELVATLAAGKGVYLMNDITVAATKGGYDKAGILQNQAQTIDGGGHTLKVTGAGATWSCAIYTNGGVIKNLTVAGAMRGIFTAGQSSDLHINNVVFKNVIYTFNSDGKMPANPFGVYVSNSTVNGWTSHSDMHTEVVYTNCSFGEGSGYAYCRPYGTTKFVDCTFRPGYTIDKSETNDITFENCTFEE